LATVFGLVALSQISRLRDRLEGKALAAAGLILDILGLSLLAVQFFPGFLAAMFCGVS
jgi:hypothetical protein